MKKYHIVFTTIYYSDIILFSLFKNISKFEHLAEVKVWIVGDRKTPQGMRMLADNFSSIGLETVYLDIESQDSWGKKFTFYQYLPYNNDTRRNIGYLKALEEGCELLISIDDDNFPHEDDFIGWHAGAGRKNTGKMIVDPSHFYNICEQLDFNPARRIYPRGFPFNLRNYINSEQIIDAPSGAIVGVNAGLWLNDPDIDAVTWLNGKVSGEIYKGPDTMVLSNDTWCPINTQNTSVVRELIPAYFNVPMGWDVPGGKIQRYGDIWGGYFLQALIKGTNYQASFGRPVVRHIRNPHNYIDDMRFEFWGMILTDWLLEELYNGFKPEEKNVMARVFELSGFLKEIAETKMPAWSPGEMKNFLLATAGNLKLWGEACKAVGI